MDDNRIPLPTEAERDRAVALLLDAALPVRPGLRQALGQAAAALSLRTLFFGVGDCLFLSSLALALCLLPAAAAAAQQGPLAPVLFLLSPALYACLQLLTAWKEAQSGTLPWKQTCRVSLRAMTALRMLVFGGASLLVCVPVDGLLWALARGALTLPRMLGLSFASLFLYGALSLACLRLRGVPGLLAAPAAWMGLGLVLLLWERAAVWLRHVPAAVFFLLAAAGLALYLTELRGFCLRQTEGGSAYALR